MDPAGLHALQDSDDFDMGYFASGMGLDPATGENVVASGSVLSQGYSNPQVDELFQEGKALSDRDERQPIYHEISEILNDELPSIWLWYDIRPLGFNTNVKGPMSHWEEQGIIYFNMPVYNEIHNWRIEE
jgi:ABC-type transport system substrate-binding protein